MQFQSNENVVDHPKSQIPSSNPRTPTAAKNMTIQPRQHPRSLNNEIVTRQMIDETNVE